MEGGPLGNRQKKSIIAFGHQSVNENRCVGTCQFNVLAWMRTNARPLPSNRKRKKPHRKHFATYKICQKWAKLHFSFPELVFWPLKGHLSDRPLRLIIARSVTKKLHFYIVISTPFFLSRFSAISNFVSSRADLFLDIGKKIRKLFSSFAVSGCFQIQYFNFGFSPSLSTLPYAEKRPLAHCLSLRSHGYWSRKPVKEWMEPHVCMSTAHRSQTKEMQILIPQTRFMRQVEAIPQRVYQGKVFAGEAC